jgi:rubrerythrin
MAFTRTIEDFTCEHCGASVTGTGFTNHCPRCLWSKHVDIEPGDRAANCGGAMEPTSVEGSTPEYVIVHTCTVCGHRRRNKTSADDDPAAVLAVVERSANAS